MIPGSHFTVSMGRVCGRQILSCERLTPGLYRSVQQTGARRLAKGAQGKTGPCWYSTNASRPQARVKAELPSVPVSASCPWKKMCGSQIADFVPCISLTESEADIPPRGAHCCRILVGLCVLCYQQRTAELVRVPIGSDAAQGLEGSAKSTRRRANHVGPKHLWRPMDLRICKLGTNAVAACFGA